MQTPPYSSGKRTPVNPRSASLGSSSIGKCWASSHSITCGAISASANSRTLVFTCCCSSVNLKFMLFSTYFCTRQRHSRLSGDRPECLSKQQIVKTLILTHRGDEL